MWFDGVNVSCAAAVPARSIRTLIRITAFTNVLVGLRTEPPYQLEAELCRESAAPVNGWGINDHKSCYSRMQPEGAALLRVKRVRVGGRTDEGGAHNLFLFLKLA